MTNGITNFSPEIKPAIAVQWHLTRRCNYRCLHCYGNEGYTGVGTEEQELPISKLFHILDSIEAYAEKYGISVFFAFTGGDPLLYPDVFKLLKEVNIRNHRFDLMCNPDRLTSATLDTLKELECSYIQLSLDGAPKTHDRIRGKGSFKKIESAVRRLLEREIPFGFMSTLNRDNHSEIGDLMVLSNELGAECFGFDVVAPIGEGERYRSLGFTKSEMRNICHTYIEMKHVFMKKKFSTRYTEKSPLFKLAHYERGEFYPKVPDDIEVVSGCLIGWSCGAILANGRMVACRRWPYPIGDLLEETFENLWLHSNVLNALRKKDNYDECAACVLYPWCRGCPATALAPYGKTVPKHPLCWRDEIPSLFSYNNLNAIKDKPKSQYCTTVNYCTNYFLGNRQLPNMKSPSFKKLLNLLRLEPFVSNFLVDPHATIDLTKIDGLSEHDIFAVYVSIIRRIEEGRTPNII